MQNISDFDKWAEDQSEKINPEIKADLEKLYKDNSATFQYFKEVDKSVQDILRNPSADDLKQLENVLPTLKKLENAITTFASKKLSREYKSKIPQLISEIKDKMSISEFEDKNKEFFELLEKNKQAIKKEWQPPKRFTDQFFHDEIAKLSKSISSCESQLSSLPYEIQSAMNEENRINNEQQKAMQRYHATGRFGFADSWENKQFMDMFSRVWDKKNSAQSSISKLQGWKTEYETKKREIESLLRNTDVFKRVENHYRSLLDRKETLSNESNEEEFITLANEFREFEGYYEDAEDLAKECEDMPRKMQYNKILRSQILAKSEQEFREIAKESRSLSMKFKDKGFLELAKECTNIADSIVEQKNKDVYNKLIKAKNNAKTEDDFQNLAKQFRELNYENSKELAKECDNQYNVHKYKRLFQEYEKASTEKEFLRLDAEFRCMNGYENSEELAKKCETRYQELKERREEQERLDNYNKLVQEKNNASEKQLLDLAKQFRAMNGYKNTEELAKECETRYQELKTERIHNEYTTALATMQRLQETKTKKPEDLRKLAKDWTKLAGEFRVNADYMDSKELVDECRQESEMAYEKAKRREKQIKRRPAIITWTVILVIILTLVYGFLNGWFDNYSEKRGYVDGMAAVKYGNFLERKWGFMDESGKEVIPCIYSDVLNFSEGLAAVRIGNENAKWGFVDKNGYEIVACKYDVVESFLGGLAKVRIENGKQGLVDRDGVEIIPCEYDNIDIFDVGIIFVMKTMNESRVTGNGSTHLMGVFNKIGQVIIPLDNYSALFLDDGKLIGVGNNKGTQYFDYSGKRVYKKNKIKK